VEIGSRPVQAKRAVGARVVVVVLVVVALAVASFALLDRHHSRVLHDAPTRGVLRAVAIRFNDNYAHDRDGLVYDRWDAASRAIITRRAYLRRHQECPSAPGSAVVEDVSRASRGYWLVHYAIDGVQLVDYWHFVDGAWRFNLARSNPDAVRLYEMPFALYARQVGCA